MHFAWGRRAWHRARGHDREELRAAHRAGRRSSDQHAVDEEQPRGQEEGAAGRSSASAAKDRTRRKREVQPGTHCARYVSHISVEEDRAAATRKQAPHMLSTRNAVEGCFRTVDGFFRRCIILAWKSVSVTNLPGSRHVHRPRQAEGAPP